MHVLGVVVQLFAQRVLVDLDLSVLEVLVSGNLVGSFVLVDLPVLVACLIPLLHKLFVFLHFLEGVLSFLLLDALEHAPFCHFVVMSFLLVVSSGHFELKQLLLDILVMLGLDGWTIHAVIFVDCWQFHGKVPGVLDLGVDHRLLQIGNG